MTPATVNTLEIRRGDNHEFSLSFNLPDESPYNLTGWTEIRMEIRKEAAPYAYLVATLSTLGDNPSLEIFGDDSNKLKIGLTSDITAKLNKEGLFQYDIRFIDSDEQFVTPLKGDLNVTFNITN